MCVFWVLVLQTKLYHVGLPLLFGKATVFVVVYSVQSVPNWKRFSSDVNRISVRFPTAPIVLVGTNADRDCGDPECLCPLPALKAKFSQVCVQIWTVQTPK
jgi:hypothetical protein